MPSDAELDAQIEKLVAEEQEVSALRRRLHDRLASFPNEVTTDKEHELSTRRRKLHAQIDALRAERSKRRKEQHD
jgi:hypothetical protein